MIPRSYQQEAVDTAFREWNAGRRSTLFVCPTGGGKSLVYCKIAERAGKGVLILADREWLVTYASDNIRATTDLSVGIEMAGQRVDRKALPDVVVASVQTMTKRFQQFSPEDFGTILIDEADLALAPSYRRIFDYFSDAKLWGCSATVERGDGVALGNLFESVSLDVDVRDLIDAGYLSKIRSHAVRVLDLKRVKFSDHDFDEKSLDRILLEEKHLHEVVSSTLDLAGDRPTLVFAVSVVHAKALSALFNRYRKGSASYTHGDLSISNRRSEVDCFRRGEVQFLCNCILLSRGVDIPPVACVVMASPTQSLTKYVQAIGRGFRLSPETGKVDCLVLDFTDGADQFSIVSAVDALGGLDLAEVRERARELLDENPGGDVLEALEEAKRQVEDDTALRERVLAKANLRVREVKHHHNIDWNVQPYGKSADKALAGILGVDKSLVAYHRKRRGIAAFRSRFSNIDWDKQPLGKETDQAIANRLECSYSLVQTARVARGIAAFVKNVWSVLTKSDWDAAGLGTRSDKDIGITLNTSAESVRVERVSRGVSAFKKVMDWESYRERLGNESPSVLAKELGLTVSGIQYAKKRMGIASGIAGRKMKPVNWNEVDFNKSDRMIATELRIAPKRVTAERNARGLPPWRTVIDYDNEPLGKLSDTELAKRLGVVTSAVQAARMKRGIPRFRRK